MSFLDHLFGKRSDPTEGWAAAHAALPDFDSTEMRFGSLRFGDPIEAAAFLGRPDRVKWDRDGNGELLYISGGFLLEFEAGEFAYLAFFIGPDNRQPDPAVAFSQPRLLGGAAHGVRLTAETNRPALERIFGTADMVDIEPDETVLTYTRRGVTIEFELDGTSGHLKRWNLYPE